MGPEVSIAQTREEDRYELKLLDELKHCETLRELRIDGACSQLLASLSARRDDGDPDSFQGRPSSDEAAG